MKITEKELLDGYDGITKGLMYISKIGGERIVWDYRRGENGDGYNPARCKREDSSQIYLHDFAQMIELDEGCENHENLVKIYNDCENAMKNC